LPLTKMYTGRSVETVEPLSGLALARSGDWLTMSERCGCPAWATIGAPAAAAVAAATTKRADRRMVNVCGRLARTRAVGQGDMGMGDLP
jgi:hypothetical protein